MYPDDFTNDSMQHTGEQWTITSTTATSTRLECEIEMQWCSNDADDWYKNQYKAMIANEILQTLNYNDAPMTLIHIVQAVQHKFWMQPQVLMSKGAPALPLYEMVFQVLLHLHEVACTGNEHNMPVWHLAPL